MKTLIVYSSTHGTTGKVAGLIWEKLDKKRTHCLHVDEVTVSDIHSYDIIVLGASVHYGEIQREMLVFCEKHFDILTKKIIALYLCGMLDGEKAENEMKNAFPQALVDIAIAYAMMGGEFLTHKMNILEKIRLKFFSGYVRHASEINYDNIDNFVSTLSLVRA